MYSYSPPQLNLSANGIYHTRDGVSPNDIEKINISTGPMTGQTDSIYHGDYSFCGPVFFSPDQSRIYTGCGTVAQASADSSVDMHYTRTLEGISRMRSLTESSVLKRIALISTDSSSSVYGNNYVRLYESDFMNPIGKFMLPDFEVGPNRYAAHGKWVFFNSTSTALIVLEQADLNSGLLYDYRLQVIPMTAPSECGAAFGSANAQVIANGSIGSVGINASAECRYNAVSQVSWIQIVSGGYGSGSGDLKYIVRANNGLARSGEITLGNSIFTVNQDEAGPPAALDRLPYNVVGAVYDKPLKKLVMISADPDELHIYDPKTRSEQIVPLSLPPLILTVHPDGLYAAVSHDGWVTYVNLQTAAVQQTYKVLSDVANILLAGNGYAYFFPTRSWSAMYSLQIAAGLITATSATFSGRIPRLYADGNYMYVGGGSDFSKWSISQGVATRVSSTSLPYSTSNLWLTEDGMRMITSGGRIYRTSSIPSEDLQSNGSLPNATNVSWADEAMIPGLTAVLAKTSGSAQGANELQLYADANLLLLRSMPMNPFSVGSSAYPGYGQYVFWNSTETNLIVIEKADTSANLLSGYGVSIVSLLNVRASFNGDSKPDLVWRNASTGEFGVWYMNGIAKTGSVSLGTSSPDWKIVGLADFNDDGETDFLWRNSISGENYIWYMNGISFTGSANLPTIADRNWIVAGVADFNRDGRVDILWHNEATGENYLWYMDGSALIAGVSLSATSDLGWKIAGLGDFNNDGKPDILWRHMVSGDNYVWYMNGIECTGGAYLQAVADQNRKIVRVEDYNGDGKVDILWRNSQTGENYVWYMNGAAVSGTASLEQVADANWLLFDAGNIAQQSAGADFNNDGKPDILWRNASTGENYIWYMSGSSVMGSSALPAVADLNWRIEGIADFNADGKTDILWRNASTGENYVWHLNGSSVAGSSVLPAVADLNWKIAGVADYNNDGKPDILWRNSSTGENYIWHMNGTSVSGGAALPTVADQNWKIAGSADFNADGKPDILWRNVSTGENYVWHLNGVAVEGSSVLPAVADLNWKIAGAADYNDDGKPDILWRNSSTGENCIWHMNGTSVSGSAAIPTVEDQNWAIASQRY
jgi:hypothetical protein